LRKGTYPFGVVVLGIKREAQITPFWQPLKYFQREPVVMQVIICQFVIVQVQVSQSMQTVENSLIKPRYEIILQV
jgi:hypothetical protein